MNEKIAELEAKETELARVRAQEARVEKEAQEALKIQEAEAAQRARAEQEQTLALQASIIDATKDPEVPTKVETVETVTNKPKADNVEVDKWDSNSPDNNDCLSRIVKNQYGVDPYSQEGQKIMAELMKSNPDIYAAGRQEIINGKVVSPGVDITNTIIYTGENMNLPTLTKQEQATVEDRDNPEYQAALAKSQALKNVNENDVLYESLQATLADKTQDLENKQQNNGILGGAWNGVIGLFGQGDKKTETTIQSQKAALEAAKGDPAKLAKVYKEIMGEEFSQVEMNKMLEAQKLAIAAPDDVKNQVVQELEAEYNKLQADLDATSNSQGWLGNSWDWFKNTTGIGAGSNKARTELDALAKQIEDIKEDPSSIAANYRVITGGNLDAAEVARINSNQGQTNILQNTDGAKKVENYRVGQTQAVDTIANITSAVASTAIVVGASAVGLVGVPFTAGASLSMVAGGIALAGATGAAVNVAMKGSDAISGGREYGVMDGLKDAGAGVLNGSIAVFSMGVGNVVTQGVKACVTNAAKTAGSRILASKAAEVAINAVSRGIGEAVADGSTGAVINATTYLQNAEDPTLVGVLGAAKDGLIVGGATGFITGAGGELLGSLRPAKYDIIDAPPRPELPGSRYGSEVIDVEFTVIDDIPEVHIKRENPFSDAAVGMQREAADVLADGVENRGVAP